jgi:hypothetical protein
MDRRDDLTLREFCSNPFGLAIVVILVTMNVMALGALALELLGII